jgi:hypothetical protein
MPRPARVSRVPPTDQLWLRPACGAGPDPTCLEVAAEPDRTAVPAGDHVMWLKAAPDPKRFAIADFQSDRAP